jgi:hypothetical protein
VSSIIDDLALVHDPLVGYDDDVRLPAPKDLGAVAVIAAMMRCHEDPRGVQVRHEIGVEHEPLPRGRSEITRENDPHTAGPYERDAAQTVLILERIDAMVKAAEAEPLTPSL